MNTIFDAPIDLLKTCHEKVRRFTNLMLKLETHVSKRGVDDNAREAAQSIVRYFTVAAPLHHQDEEDDLFPALRMLSPDAMGVDLHEVLSEALDRLEAEHQTLDQLWGICSIWLKKLEQGENHSAPVNLKEFVEKYQRHTAQEEAEIYPHAAFLNQETLQALGLKMAQRRGYVAH